MTQNRATPGKQAAPDAAQNRFASTYYGLLAIHPWASVREIRRAYRDLSKSYHPDTTTLAAEVAVVKFQQLNEAYATLSSPERRLAYDHKIGYSRVAVVQPLPSLQNGSKKPSSMSSSAYLDPTDRPLSPGEVFALFLLGLTFLTCLVLAIAIAITRGEATLQSTAQLQPTQPSAVSVQPAPSSELPLALPPKPPASESAQPLPDLPLAAPSETVPKAL